MRTGCVNRDYSNSAVGEEMFRDYDSRGDDMLRDMELMTKQFEDTATVNTQIPKYQKLYENRHKKAASIKNIKVSWSGNERSGRARRGRARRGRTRRGRTRCGRARRGRTRCGRSRRGRSSFSYEKKRRRLTRHSRFLKRTRAALPLFTRTYVTFSNTRLAREGQSPHHGR